MIPHQPQPIMKIFSAQEDITEKRIVQLQLNRGNVDELLRAKSLKGIMKYYARAGEHARAFSLELQLFSKNSFYLSYLQFTCVM